VADNAGFGIGNKIQKQQLHPECLASGSSEFQFHWLSL